MRDKLTKIVQWAEQFGLVKLENFPESNRRNVLRFQDSLWNEYIDVIDGGLGVGQLLYIIVECCLAEPGAIILIDEPEIHLHAKFQALLLDLLLETIHKGVQVIIATHSDYLLLRLQLRIAEAKVDSTNVIVLETKKDFENRNISIKELEFTKEGYYKDEIPETIKFTQNELQKWNIQIQKSTEGK